MSQVISNFETGTDGWHSEGDGVYLWEAGTGNPGGCFRVNDDATGDWNNAIAPVKFLGNWSAATASDYVSADIFVYQINGSNSTGTYVFRIAGPGGEATAFNNAHPTPGTWINYTAYLDPANWVMVSGTWADLTANITVFVVRAEYIYGDEYDLLDNITLSLSPQVIQISPTICSDFEDGTFDGWAIQNSAGVTNNATGGNPGRCLRITDGTGISTAFPPPKFLGDWTLLDNHNADIRVDLKVTDFTAGILLSSYFVKISGPGGEAQIPMENSISDAFNRWHTFVFPVDESYWTVTSGTWDGLISFVNSCELIVEFINGTEIVWLDNFCISNLAPIADFTANKFIEFAGNPVTFTDLSANGPTGWNWDFGDSQSSSDQYPVHTYLSDGIYEVSLTASNNFGSDTETKTAYIEILPIDECLKFEDNFDDGTINPFIMTKNGTWSETEGNIRQTSNHFVTGNLLGGCYAMTGSFLWDNYVIDCDMMSTDNDHIGFVFNWQDDLNTYMFYWNAEGSYRRISKWINGTETIIATEPVPYVPNTWYIIEITTIPGNIKLSINGAPVFDVNDNTFTHGKVALFCSGNQSSYWDNLSIHCLASAVNLKAYLEGPLNSSGMNTNLNSLNLLPLVQPYNVSPWLYPGLEPVGIIPNGNVVDWVLVEFRDAVNAASAIASTRIERQAGFLLNNGLIVGTDGASPLNLSATVTNNLFVVIRHRNHLGILSSTPVTFSGGIYSYDFTSGSGQAYGSDSQKNLGSGIYGMYAGDFNADGTINLNDITNPWGTGAGKYGYLQSDGDFDGQADNNDKNDYWFINRDKSSHVPE